MFDQPSSDRCLAGTLPSPSSHEASVASDRHVRSRGGGARRHGGAAAGWPGRAPAGPPTSAPRARRRLPRPSYGWSVAGAVLVGLALRAAIGLTDDAPTTDEVAYIASGDVARATAAASPEAAIPSCTSRRWCRGCSASAAVCSATRTPRRWCSRAWPARPSWCPWPCWPAGWPATSAGWSPPGPPRRRPASPPCPPPGARDPRPSTRCSPCRPWRRRCAGAAGPPRRMLACVGGAGLLVGLAYLTRPEGLAVALAARRGGDRRRLAGRTGRRAARAALVFCVALLLCVAPYVGYLHAHTGEWQLTAKSQDASHRGVARGRPQRPRSAGPRAVRPRRDRAALRGRAGAADDPGPARSGGLRAHPRHERRPRWARTCRAGGCCRCPCGGWPRGRRSGGATTAGSCVVGAVAALPVLTALAFFVQPPLPGGHGGPGDRARGGGRRRPGAAAAPARSWPACWGWRWRPRW